MTLMKLSKYIAGVAVFASEGGARRKGGGEKGTYVSPWCYSASFCLSQHLQMPTGFLLLTAGGKGGKRLLES